ncbi:MAG: hypothetical protein IKM04_02295 [Clostridia bacterium]|nr:hypothetical protein [Clostridia bacterium]
MSGRLKKTLYGVLIALLLSAVLFGVAQRLTELKGELGRTALENTERALRRAAAACYAVEGVYPPSVDYLIEHYGLAVDLDRYAVFYEVYAENLMPDITVIER